MARFRAGAYNKGSRQKGQYVVVEAASRAQAMLDVRKLFPGVPIARVFAFDADAFDQVSNTKRPFTAKPTRGSQ